MFNRLNNKKAGGKKRSGVCVSTNGTITGRDQALQGQRSELLETGEADFCRFITEFLMMEQLIQQITK